MSAAIDDFLERRKQRWIDLSGLVLRLEAEGPTRLTPDEIEALGRLYRVTAADLAQPGRSPSLPRRSSSSTPWWLESTPTSTGVARIDFAM